MKKCKKILLFLGILLLIPTSVFAKNYKALNLEETLTSEKIEHNLKNYKETKDQITIYMFRGERCGHCQNFLKFLNENIEEYGKYFKLVSFEVWRVEDNATLMEKVANHFNLNIKGVPFIVIGETTYQGFNENRKEEILETIKNYYENKNTYKDVVAPLLKVKTNDTTDAAITIVVVLATLSIVGFLIYTAKGEVPESETKNLEIKEEKIVTEKTPKETNKVEQEEKQETSQKEAAEKTRSNEKKKTKEVALPKLKEEKAKPTTIKKATNIELPKKKETNASSKTEAKVKKTSIPKEEPKETKTIKKETTAKKTTAKKASASKETKTSSTVKKTTTAKKPTTNKKSTATKPKQTTKK